eukprot:c35934_g1_i1 orf=94-243(+)
MVRRTSSRQDKQLLALACRCRSKQQCHYALFGRDDSIITVHSMELVKEE